MLKRLAALLEVLGFATVIVAAVTLGFRSPVVYLGIAAIIVGWVLALVAQRKG